MRNEHKLTVISGPSGCGKDTVVKKILGMREDCRLSVSCTTRAPREGEMDGREYYFISKEEFQDRIDRGRMLEYNFYAGNFYGTPKDELEAAFERGETVFLVIDVNGGKRVKEMYPGALMIFLLPPSMEELKRRILSRGSETEETAAERLKIAEEELAQQQYYDYRVVNDDLDRCVDEVLRLMDGWQDEAEKVNNPKEIDKMKTPIGRLLEEKESAYSLVIAVAKRARDIVSEADANGEHLDDKPVTIAINEFDQHKFDVVEAEDGKAED